ncbi:MAG TPA: PAS domain-containing protein [Alphaproteobacteria bacterium]|nr:PAS domain-containing protein [Alphaproteobacteria bacterium]
MAARQFQVISGKDFLPAGVHDDLWQFLAFWRAKAATRLPRRREIDPLEIARLLPRVLLLDVEADDFRFSLVGEDITARYGQIRGRSLRELMNGPELSLTIEEHRICVSTQLPVFSQNSMQSASLGDQQVYQRLLTPFAGDGDTVTCLAGIMVFRSE